MSDRPRGPISQVAVGILVALLVGGSVPWWWSDLKARFSSHPSQVTEKPAPSPQEAPPPSPQPAPNSDEYSQSDYEAVQSIYERRQNAKTCVDVKRLTSRMQQYFGNQHLVPPKFVDTIQYPVPVPKPTISDLAKDRIARIKDARPKCFP
jgi:hypothetical protein